MAGPDDLTLEGELLRLLQADPFAPFLISLTSGERLEIQTPDFIIGKNVATYIGPRSHRVIRKNQIVALDLPTSR